MISLSGVYAGQLIAYPVSTWIVAAFSWRAVFYFNALVGFLWVGLWLWWGADTPPNPTANVRRTGEAEKRGTGESGELPKAQTERARVPIGALVTTPAVVALAVAYFFWAYGLTMVVAWLPTYLVQARGFTMQQMGWVGMLPVSGGLIGVLGGGVLSDWLIKRGVSITWARKGIPAGAIAVSAPLLALAASISSPTSAVLAFALFQMLTTLGLVAFWSIPVEMNTRLAGSIASIMNFGGNFGGFFSPMVAGFVVKRTGDWTLPFYTAAAGCLLGALVLAFLVPVRAIDFASKPGVEKEAKLRRSAGT
jgi:ACS family glucarate transporter-like MFS transporter